MARFHNPYAGDGVWLKGNLHTHTTASDGHFSLAEVAAAYRKFDYDFLAITDHDVQVDLSSVDFGLTLLPGVEATKAMSHILCIGWSQDNMRGRFRPDKIGTAEFQEMIDLVGRAGGVSILAHPHWLREDYWSLTDLLSLRGYTGIEVFNGDDVSPITHVSTDLWDGVLSAGVRAWGFGADDFHHLGQLRRVWTVAKAASREPVALLDALRQGRHYISTGVELAEVGADGDWIHVSVARNGFTERYEKQFRFIGTGGRVLQTVSGRNPSAAYKAIGDEQYVRVQVLVEFGHVAYTQPFFREQA